MLKTLLASFSSSWLVLGVAGLSKTQAELEEQIRSGFLQQRKAQALVGVHSEFARKLVELREDEKASSVPLPNLPPVTPSAEDGGKASEKSGEIPPPSLPVPAGPPRHAYLPLTWGFLRESADGVGDAAQEVLLLENSMDSMHADISQALRHWAEEREVLNNRNTELKAELTRFEQQEAANKEDQAAVARAQQETANIQKKTKAEEDGIAKDQQKFLGEKQMLNGEITKLETAVAGYQAFYLKEQKQEQSDLMILLQREKTEDGGMRKIQDRIAEAQKEIVADQREQLRQTSTLQRQIDSLKTEIASLQRKVVDAEREKKIMLDAELVEGQASKALETEESRFAAEKDQCVKDLASIEQQTTKILNEEVVSEKAKLDQCETDGVRENRKLEVRLRERCG